MTNTMYKIAQSVESLLVDISHKDAPFYELTLINQSSIINDEQRM